MPPESRPVSRNYESGKTRTKKRCGEQDSKNYCLTTGYKLRNFSYRVAIRVIEASTPDLRYGWRAPRRWVILTVRPFLFRRLTMPIKPSLLAASVA